MGAPGGAGEERVFLLCWVFDYEEQITYAVAPRSPGKDFVAKRLRMMINALQRPNGLGRSASMDNYD